MRKKMIGRKQPQEEGFFTQIKQGWADGRAQAKAPRAPRTAAQRNHKAGVVAGASFMGVGMLTFGLWFIVIGIVLCFTIIGAIIGVPLILGGALCLVLSLVSFGTAGVRAVTR